MKLKLTLLLLACIVTVALSSVFVSASMCYQESANVSNQTGIDGSCGLS